MATRKPIIDKAEIKNKLIEAGICNDDIDNIIREIDMTVSKLIKQNIVTHTKKTNNIYEQGELFLDIYPDYLKYNLPSWVLENINEARIIGTSKKTIILSDGRRYQLNNALNHLSGGAWTYFTNSVFNSTYKTNGADSFAHKIRKIHPTPKPPQLMRDIIEFFTKENELVFDYFMGVGGSLLGAGLSNRKAIGVDLNSSYINAYKAAAAEIGCSVFKCIEGDCLDILSDNLLMKELLMGEQISLVLLDPPYGNMMSREKTGADIKVYGNIATPFTNSDKDFGNLDLPIFFEKLKKSVELILPYIKPKGHIVIFIKDLQPNGKSTNLLHSELVNKLNEIDNINYKGLKIWADQTAKLFPYGYPFSFVANQIHQYILIFRKEK